MSKVSALHTKEDVKRLVADSSFDDNGAGLTDYDRDILGQSAVQIRIPLRDPIECRLHLEMLKNAAIEMLLMFENAPDEPGRRRGAKSRSLLYAVQGRMRALNRKLNANRRLRQG